MVALSFDKRSRVMDSNKPTPGPDIVLEGVSLSFGEHRVLSGLDARFPAGKISVVLGASGAGKSTLFRLVAGLLRADHGRLMIGDTDVGRAGGDDLIALRRLIGMLFQGGALLDSLSVYDNRALPLRECSTLGEAAIRSRIDQRLAEVGLTDVGSLLPRELSGGMLRRVALARAMILDPRILLCDEPFSGLDPLTLRRIEAVFRATNRRLGLTTLLVSHDLPSTMRLADHVLLLLPGLGVQGTPAELLALDHPAVRLFLDQTALSSPDELETACPT